MSEKTHHEVIATIARNEFGAEPELIERMTTGICNEVYTVTIGGREYIFRLNSEPRFMLGSHNHIPLFKSKGIRVPEILAEDLSKKVLPLAWQVQNKIPGRDITNVIETLTDDQLRSIGGEVANVFRQLSNVPNNGKFGVLWGDDRDLVDSWSAEVARVTKVVIGWGRQSGVLDAKIEKVLTWLNTEYKSYFDRVRPYTYYGDICAKNVMVHNGQFSGLVDLDAIAQGDPLEAIGRIKASWYGTRHGKVYSEAVMDSLGLPEPQRKLVTMYALLNRAFWTLENGHQFNQNTSRTVDREREAQDKRAVDELMVELQGVAPTPAAVIESPSVPAVVVEPTVIPEPAAEPLVVAESSDTAIAEPLPALQIPLVPVKPVRRSRAKKAVIAEPAVMIPKPEGEPDIETRVFDPTETLTELAVEPSVNVLRSEPVTQSSQQKIMLEASGLSKTYVSDSVAFNALKNVDLRIHQGDCVAIVGKSGSGKSTLMHLLACLDIPTEGYVYVDGEETSTMLETEKNTLRNEKFGFVFQQFFLNGRDTVFENVVLPLRIRGVSDFDMITDADEALAAVGLADKSDNSAKDLSGGEKQRVCIARALVGKPQVIFADEPTGNLDSNTGAAVEKMLFDLNREKGITLVIVTHDADLSKRCGRIIEMKDGQIIAETTGEVIQ